MLNILIFPSVAIKDPLQKFATTKGLKIPYSTLMPRNADIEIIQTIKEQPKLDSDEF
jgi:hypothetical protein